MLLPARAPPASEERQGDIDTETAYLAKTCYVCKYLQVTLVRTVFDSLWFCIYLSVFTPYSTGGFLLPRSRARKYEKFLNLHIRPDNLDVRRPGTRLQMNFAYFRILAEFPFSTSRQPLPSNHCHSV